MKLFSWNVGKTWSIVFYFLCLKGWTMTRTRCLLWPSLKKTIIIAFYELVIKRLVDKIGVTLKLFRILEFGTCIQQYFLYFLMETYKRIILKKKKKSLLFKYISFEFRDNPWWWCPTINFFSSIFTPSSYLHSNSCIMHLYSFLKERSHTIWKRIILAY